MAHIRIYNQQKQIFYDRGKQFSEGVSTQQKTKRGNGNQQFKTESTS